MIHTGRAFGPWTVTSVDDWKTFAKDETRTYTGVLLEVEVSWDLSFFLSFFHLYLLSIFMVAQMANQDRHFWNK